MPKGFSRISQNQQKKKESIKGSRKREGQGGIVGSRKGGTYLSLGRSKIFGTGKGVRRRSLLRGKGGVRKGKERGRRTSGGNEEIFRTKLYWGGGWLGHGSCSTYCQPLTI